MDTSWMIALAVALVALVSLLVLGYSAFVRAEPDEWLLVIREGALVRANVGTSAFRLPSRSVVRFTSTLQRVKFSVEAESREHVGVTIEGFILWTVSAEGDGPFRAYQSLGIHDLGSAKGRAMLKSEKHLLAPSQHRAFQALLHAHAQRYASTASLDRLLSDQDRLVLELGARFREATAPMGAHIAEVQVSKVRPTESAILEHLSVRHEGELREAAKRDEIAVAHRIQRMTVDARHEEQSYQIEKERELAEKRQESERLRRTQEGELRALEQTLDGANAMARAKDGAERDRVMLELEVDRVERLARAQADAIQIVASAEEKKSQAVRDYQLTEKLGEQVTRAVEKLPIKEARWTSIGGSPMGSVAQLVKELRASIAE